MSPSYCTFIAVSYTTSPQSAMKVKLNGGLNKTADFSTICISVREMRDAVRRQSCAISRLALQFLCSSLSSFVSCEIGSHTLVNPLTLAFHLRFQFLFLVFFFLLNSISTSFQFRCSLIDEDRSSNEITNKSTGFKEFTSRAELVIIVRILPYHR